jgi:prepilin-type N-terminal cleavage/methylation domain-containing protein
MTQKKKRLQKVDLKDGFTIIEVVLVLAIAGLIFLMVFIALPALQRSQRDTQRRDDIARANTALTQFMTNNRNRVPQFEDGSPSATTTESQLWGDCPLTGETATNSSGFCAQYLTIGGDSFEDPDGSPYQFKLKEDDAGTGEGGDDTEITKSTNEGEPYLLSTLAASTPVYGPVSGTFEDNEHTIWVTYNAKCDGESTVASTGDRKVALQYKLEGGGVVCVNN